MNEREQHKKPVIFLDINGGAPAGKHHRSFRLGIHLG